MRSAKGRTRLAVLLDTMVSLIPAAHFIQPGLDGWLQHLAVVTGQGVVLRVQHQRLDAMCREKIRVDALDGFENIFRVKIMGVTFLKMAAGAAA